MVNDIDKKIVDKAVLPYKSKHAIQFNILYCKGFLAGYKQAMSDIIQYLDTKNEG